MEVRSLVFWSAGPVALLTRTRTRVWWPRADSGQRTDHQLDVQVIVSFKLAIINTNVKAEAGPVTIKLVIETQEGRAVSSALSVDVD